MKTKIPWLFLLVLLQQLAVAQGRVVVEIRNFKNDRGTCIVSLYDNARAFSGKGEPMHTLRVPVAGRSASAAFEAIPAGRYAIAVVHDANNNNRFDTNFIGIPTEGYGASQNKLPFAAAPKFEENTFLVGAGTHTSVNIRLRYLF